MIKFRCEHCGHKLGVPETYIGRTVRCPHCKAGNTVPNPEPAPEPTPEPAPEPEYDDAPAEEEMDELSALAAMAGGGGGGYVPGNQDSGDYDFEGDAGGGSGGGFVPEPEPEPEPEPKPQTKRRESAPAFAVAPEPPQRSRKPSSRSATPPPASASPAAIQPTPPPAADHHTATTPTVRATTPPTYAALKIGAIALFVFAGLSLLGSLIVGGLGLAAGISASDEPAAQAGTLIAAGTMIYGVGIAIMLSVLGTTLLALRDIARNSWYHREIVALLRARP